MSVRCIAAVLGIWLCGGTAALAATAPIPLYTPAPMPDLTQEPPRGRAGTPGPTLTPNLYSRPQATTESDGYTRGSAMQYDEPRGNQLRPSPGLQLNVPLN
jgi:hypothetical protein